MALLPVIVGDDYKEEDDNELGLFSSEKEDIKVKFMDADLLRESLKAISEGASEIFQDIKKVGEFNLKEVQLQVDITAECGFALIGSAKAGAKGAVTLTFSKD